MTEREKMLAGELYDCGDAELLLQWHKAKDLRMKIDIAEMKDLDQITEVERVCFPEAEAAKRDSMERRLQYFPNHFWLLKNDEELVGFVNGIVSDEDHLYDEMYDRAELHNENGKWQMIFGVDIIEKYRHRGLGGYLLRHVIETARREKRKGLVLTCKEHLIPFYEKCGFQDEGISCSEHGGVQWHEMRLIFAD